MALCHCETELFTLGGPVRMTTVAHGHTFTRRHASQAVSANGSVGRQLCMEEVWRATLWRKVKSPALSEWAQPPGSDKHQQPTPDKHLRGPEIWDCDSFRNYCRRRRFLPYITPSLSPLMWFRLARTRLKGPSCSGGGIKKTQLWINSLYFLPLWLSSSLFSSLDRMPAIRARGCVPSSVFIRPENTAVRAQWDYLADTGCKNRPFYNGVPICLAVLLQPTGNSPKPKTLLFNTYIHGQCFKLLAMLPFCSCALTFIVEPSG